MKTTPQSGSRFHEKSHAGDVAGGETLALGGQDVGDHGFHAATGLTSAISDCSPLA